MNLEQLINDFKIPLSGPKPLIEKTLESTSLNYSGGVVAMFDRQLEAIFCLRDTNLLSIENHDALIATLTQDVKNLLIDMNIKPCSGRMLQTDIVLAAEAAKRFNLVRPVIYELERELTDAFDPDDNQLHKWFCLALKAKCIVNGEEVPRE